MAFSTIRITLVYCLAHVALAARDYKICDVVTESCGLIPPALPKDYEMRAGTTQYNNQTLIWEEFYFGYTELKAKYVHLSEGIERHYLFDYENEQIIKYFKLHPGTDIKKDPLSFTCKVESMDSSQLRYIFGYRDGQFVSKHSRMYNSHQALRFGGEYQYAFNGTSGLTDRGLGANHFYGCIYDTDADATEEIVYSFSTDTVIPSGSYDKDDAATRNEASVPLPLANQYRGVMHLQNDEDINFNNSMHIAWFKGEPNFNYDTFKIPPWMYCDGYRGSRPMPKLPSAFMSGVEMSSFAQDLFGKMSAAEVISYYGIYYNYNKQLARRDFTPIPERDGEIITKFENQGPVKQIFDFNDGVKYTIHKTSGRCFPSPIVFGDYFETTKETMYTIMATPEELYGLDPKNQEYKGKYFARDIETNVWAGKSFDKNLNVSVYRETYFSTDGWHEEANEMNEYTVPIRQTMVVSSEVDGDFSQSVTETNFFKFKIVEPPLVAFETRGCVEHLKHKFLVISLSVAPKDEDFIISNLWYFHQAMQIYIAKVSEIGTPLRVQRVQLQTVKEQYFLVFAFVDKALTRTNAMEPGLTIEKAIDFLLGFIELGKFELKFTVPGSEERRVTATGLFELPGGDKTAKVEISKKIRAFSNHVAHPKRESFAFLRDDTKKIVKVEKKGMSAGGLAGLAIGMLIIGVGIGVGVMWFYAKRYDNSGQTLFSMKG